MTILEVWICNHGLNHMPGEFYAFLMDCSALKGHRNLCLQVKLTSCCENSALYLQLKLCIYFRQKQKSGSTMPFGITTFKD